MKSLLIPLAFMAAVAVALLTELAKELFVTEAKTRLERLPLAILRLARRRAHPDIRTWIYDEVWLPDFEYITARHKDSRSLAFCRQPVSRWGSGEPHPRCRRPGTHTIYLM